MVRFVFYLLLVTLCGSSSAGVYKCMQADGKIEYQAAPCVTGKEALVKTPISAPQELSSNPEKLGPKNPCGGRGMQIKFESLAVISLLGLLADYSGNRLQADESIVARGAFDYRCVPIESILRDVALRYNLDVRVENGIIYARSR